METGAVAVIRSDMTLMDLLEVFSNGDCTISTIPVVDASYGSAKKKEKDDEVTEKVTDK